MYPEKKILDHGYLRLVEFWGKGDFGESEAGIIEAARQSTKGCFRGWDESECTFCDGVGNISGISCKECDGRGKFPGDKKLLNYLYKMKHSTPFEFAGMTIEVQAPLMVFREWHRHRTQSYSELSARYSPMPDMNYIPTVERCMVQNSGNKQANALKGADVLTSENTEAWIKRLEELYKINEEFYQFGLKNGIPKELARMIIPVGRYSKMRATGNLRNWLAFLTLRMDPAAQYEIRMFANAVGEIIEEKFPRTWYIFNQEQQKKMEK